MGDLGDRRFGFRGAGTKGTLRAQLISCECNMRAHAIHKASVTLQCRCLLCVVRERSCPKQNELQPRSHPTFLLRSRCDAATVERVAPAQCLALHRMPDCSSSFPWQNMAAILPQLALTWTRGLLQAFYSTAGCPLAPQQRVRMKEHPYRWWRRWRQGCNIPLNRGGKRYDNDPALKIFASGATCAARMRYFKRQNHWLLHEEPNRQQRLHHSTCAQHHRRCRQRKAKIPTSRRSCSTASQVQADKHQSVVSPRLYRRCQR